MNQRTTKIILFAILISFGAALFYYWKRNKKETTVFKTKQPTIENIQLTSIATGKIIPDEEVSIRPNINGIVSKVYVKAGQSIKAGDKIADIKVVPSISNLQSSRNGVAREQIAYNNQEKIFNRQKELFDKGVISANNFDNSQAAFLQAKQRLNSAKENYQIVKTGTAKGFNAIANTSVKATISGVILDVPVKKGNQVIQNNNFKEGSEIAVIADVKKMIFEGSIDESDVGKIKEDMPIKITVGAYPNKIYNGVLNYISPKGRTKNGAVEFEIEAKLNLNEDDYLRAGLSANANIILEEVKDVLAVDEGLVQYDKKTKKPFVEVAIGEEQFERKDIELGLSDGIKVEIKNGISIEDNIKEWNAIGRPEKKNKKKKKY